MSLYQKIATIGPKFIKRETLLKYAFNWSPMYKRSTAKLTFVSADLLTIKIKLPLSYKNRNYVNAIFGGSMFSAVDPIPMVQLINLIGEDYVVWDKSAEINFKKPAKEHLYAEFNYTVAELNDIKSRVAAEHEIEIVKTTLLQDKSGSKVFCEVKKVIYIADKAFYKEKLKKRKTDK